MDNFAHSVAQHIGKCNAAYALTAMNDTPFPVVQAVDKNIAFHLVELNTCLNLQKNMDRFFFSRLSAQFEQRGVQLVQLWEDVWRRQRSLVESRIAVLLGNFKRYHARQTTVKSIANPVLKQFLQQHHLQVAINGRYKYGLFLNGELLAVASFSAVCPINRSGKIYRSYELLRFANQAGCVVAGGLSKLLAHFVQQQQPDDIMTYADCDWGTGQSYRQLGFTQVGVLAPQPFLVDTATFERHYADRANATNATITCYNSGSYKFVKLFK
jgi:hypothetical protein